VEEVRFITEPILPTMAEDDETSSLLVDDIADTVIGPSALNRIVMINAK
jgi:hypothetical protein